MAETQKICRLCEKDVSTEKRVKDQQGRYYCHPCWAIASRPTKTNIDSAVSVPKSPETYEVARPPLMATGGRPTREIDDSRPTEPIGTPPDGDTEIGTDIISAPAKSLNDENGSPISLIRRAGSFRLIMAASGIVACAVIALAVNKLRANRNAIDQHVIVQSRSAVAAASVPPSAEHGIDPVTSFNEFVKKFGVAANEQQQVAKQVGFPSYTFGTEDASIDVAKSDSLVSPYLGTMKISALDGVALHQMEIQFQFKAEKWVLFTVTSATEVTEYHKIGTKRLAGIDVDDLTTAKRAKDDSDEMKQVVREIVQRIDESPQAKRQREAAEKKQQQEHDREQAAKAQEAHQAEVARYEQMDIYEASKQGAVDRVKTLLTAAPEMSREKHLDNGQVSTPLAVAANKEVAELLIRAGADVNARDNFNCAPLHSAANAGNIGVMEALLTAHADVNAMDDTMGTPLHWAAMAGKLAAIKMLVSHGADVNAAGPHGDTPLDEAINTKQLDVIEWLRRHGGKTTK